jgi:hypothetical protein
VYLLHGAICSGVLNARPRQQYTAAGISEYMNELCMVCVFLREIRKEVCVTMRRPHAPSCTLPVAPLKVDASCCCVCRQWPHTLSSPSRMFHDLASQSQLAISLKILCKPWQEPNSCLASLLLQYLPCAHTCLPGLYISC